MALAAGFGVAPTKDASMSKDVSISREIMSTIVGMNSRGNLLVLPLVLAVFVVAAVSQLLYVLPNHDSVWLLIAAERMLEGGTYERDFFEVNPPLAILLHAPAFLIQKITGQTAYSSFIVLMLIYAAVSVAFLRKIIADGFSPTSDFRLWLLPIAAMLLLIFPGYDFGQREHLFCIFVFPYLTLHATQSSRGTLPPGFMILVSVWAGLGLFLKPVFLLLPILIALDRAIRRRSVSSLFSVDMITFGVMGLIYIAVVLFRFPDYFIVTRYALEFYGAYKTNIAFATLLPVLYASSGVLLAFIATRLTESLEERRMFALLMLAAGVASVSAIVQQKGWSYHNLPIAIFVMTLVLMTIVKASRFVRRNATSRGFGLLARVAPLLAIAIFLQPFSLGTENLHRQDLVKSKLYPTLELVAANKRVYFFSTRVVVATPWVEMVQARWASRFSCLWLLPGYMAAGNDGALSAARWAELGREIRRYVNEDFERYRPEVVLVDRREFQYGLSPSFEFLKFFLAEDRFVKIWESYNFYKTVDDFDIYLLLGSTGVDGSAIKVPVGIPPT